MDMFKANGMYCVNVLPSEQRDLAANFAGAISNMDERYASADWTKLTHDLPALRDAIVSFACEIIDVNRVGTHDIIVGRVIDIRQRPDGNALLYFDRHYVHVPTQSGSFGG